MPEIVRHSLKSDGAWVELRDVSLVRAGERKAAMAKVYTAARHSPSEGEEPSVSGIIEMIEASTDFAEFVAAALIVRWYVPDLHEEVGGPQALDRRDLAGTVVQINDLRSDDYDRLLELATPAIEMLMPRSITPDQVDDPKSPSEPASV